MANLIVDEGNTLCKIAVLDKNEVLCERSVRDFDMAEIVSLISQFTIEKAVVASTRGGAAKICEQLRLIFSCQQRQLNLEFCLTDSDCKTIPISDKLM